MSVKVAGRPWAPSMQSCIAPNLIAELLNAWDPIGVAGIPDAGTPLNADDVLPGRCWLSVSCCTRLGSGQPDLMSGSAMQCPTCRTSLATEWASYARQLRG